MNVEDIKVCVLRVGGTNCDAETQRAFTELGAKAEVVQVSDMIKQRNLLDYNVLVFPGGFSYGDYVRSGVIFARHLSAHLGKEIEQFVDEGRPSTWHLQRLPNPCRIRLTPRLQRHQRIPRSNIDHQRASRLQMQMGLPQTGKPRQMRLHSAHPPRQNHPAANRTRRRQTAVPQRKRTSATQETRRRRHACVPLLHKRRQSSRRQIPRLTPTAASTTSQAYATLKATYSA